MEEVQRYRIDTSGITPTIILMRRDGRMIKKVKMYRTHSVVHTNYCDVGTPVTNGDPNVYRTLSSLVKDEFNNELAEFARRGFPTQELEELRVIEIEWRPKLFS